MPGTPSRSQLLVAATTFLFLFALSAPVHGQPILIVSTESGTPGELVIRGSGFTEGLLIFLDLAPAPVVSLNATEMRATIGAVVPGSHWLVAYHPATGQFAQFWTTLGAVGPPGAEGPQGVPGPAGPPGPPGPSGGILNQSAVAQPASFNIDGTGSAGVINAGTHYGIGGERVLTAFGFANLFAGFGAGEATTTGSLNTFFGAIAGQQITSGSENTFVGVAAGRMNTTGTGNTYVGGAAGRENSIGSENTFVGVYAGLMNQSAHGNTFVGYEAGRNSWNYPNAFFGRRAGLNNSSGFSNVFVGPSAGDSNVSGSNNTYVGYSARGNADTLLGTAVGAFAHADGARATALGANAKATGAGATAIGEGATAFGGSVVIGGPNNFRVELRGDTTVFGLLNASYGQGGFVPVCRVGPQLAQCSSSARYKTGVRPYRAGLALVERLRPVSFRWKSDGTRDLGFTAEDVARIEPRLVTRNADGQVEGVKYDRLTAVLINAVHEQQSQIARQRARMAQLETQVEEQRRQIERLTSLVCAARAGNCS